MNYARAPGAPVPEFRVEIVYDDPYDNPVESFDWTLEQIANTIRNDDLEWNPDFRAFDQNQPLLTGEYQDVRGNQIYQEVFVSHQDGSRLTGDELEQIAMSARGDLPITMRQQRLPLSAEANPVEIPIMTRRTARRNRPAALSGAGKKIQELQQQMEEGKITPEEFEAYLEEMEASQKHSGAVRILVARARAATATYVDAVEATTHVAAQSRSAAIDSADIVLLQNAIKQLGRTQDADSAVALLRDIVDAAGEMMTELGG